MDIETQKQLAEAIIKLAPILAQDVTSQINENKWVSTEEALLALGNGISGETLRSKAREGKFTYGKEYIDLSEGKCPSYAWKISAIRKYFAVHPAKRPPTKVTSIRNKTA